MYGNGYAETIENQGRGLFKTAFFVFALLVLGQGKALASNQIIHPTPAVNEYCRISGCDFQVFYRYFYTNKARFCADKQRIETHRRQNAIRGYMMSEMTEAGLPRAVGLIPMLESSYSIGNRQQNSSQKAAGPWQFLPETAEDMGLLISEEVDERFDLQKSTAAGARYIKWLVGKFDGDLNLAVLSYHAGIGRIEKLIDTYQIDNPWFLSKLISENYPDKDYLAKFHSYALALTTNGCGE